MKERIQDWYRNSLGEEWYKALEEFLKSDEMEEIRTKTLALRQSGKTILPTADVMFNAFKLTPLDEVKVVILGQEPYSHADLSDGLAYSSKDNRPIPVQLASILDALEVDLSNGLDINKYEKHNLDRWAKQGVLLLNATLTVELNNPSGHTYLWEPFTKAVFKALQYRTGIVYVFLEHFDNTFKDLIFRKSNFVLDTAHLASVYSGEVFRNSKPFTFINSCLDQQGTKIDWNEQ